MLPQSIWKSSDQCVSYHEPTSFVTLSFSYKRIRHFLSRIGTFLQPVIFYLTGRNYPTHTLLGEVSALFVCLLLNQGLVDWDTTSCCGLYYCEGSSPVQVTFQLVETLSQWVHTLICVGNLHLWIISKWIFPLSRFVSTSTPNLEYGWIFPLNLDGHNL